MTYLAIKRGVPVKAAAVIGAVTDVKAWVDARPGMGIVNGNEFIDGFANIWPDYEHRAEEYYRSRSASTGPIRSTCLFSSSIAGPNRMVPVTQALRMAEALQENGKVYALRIYERDGHPLPRNRDDRDRMIVDWFTELAKAATSQGSILQRRKLFTHACDTHVSSFGRVRAHQELYG